MIVTTIYHGIIALGFVNEQLGIILIIYVIYGVLHMKVYLQIVIL
jgi:hypothetical protein